MESEKRLVELNLHECAIDMMDFSDIELDVLLMKVMNDSKNSEPDPPQRSQVDILDTFRSLRQNSVVLQC